jgi:hypothetical protein
MAENKESYWSKHHTGIIQCVLGAYCAVFATWAYFHPNTSPVVSPATPPTGGPMNSSYSMPLGLLLGIIALVLSVVIPAAIKLIRGAAKKAPSPQTSGVMPGIPTLSALLGQHSNPTFNPKQFFALAYHSPITAEIENNIKEIAEKYYPNDKENFYAKFIGVGAVAYAHEVTWYSIFGSQLAAMAEMNFRGQIPIADVKKHYAKATVAFPDTYKTYSFGQWMEYLKLRMLIAVYPSQMAELSFNGKDFLKYMAHVGWKMDGRPN